LWQPIHCPIFPDAVYSFAQLVRLIRLSKKCPCAAISDESVFYGIMQPAQHVRAFSYYNKQAYISTKPILRVSGRKMTSG
jgi:hypothetical protein